MSPLLLAIPLLAYFFLELGLTDAHVRKNAWRWWYTPWFALLYIIVLYLVYRLFDLPNSVLLNWLVEDYIAETFYSLAGLLLWIPLQLLLRRPSLHDSLIRPYRRLFSRNEAEQENLLPFPYYLSAERTIVSRVGRVYYQLFLKLVLILAVVVYAIALIIAHFYPDTFFPLSAFGILGLLPILEYYFYLSAVVEEEEETENTKGKEQQGPGDFDKLWEVFVDTFDNYNIAWRRRQGPDDMEKKAVILGTNNRQFDTLLNRFKNQHKGGIIEDSDLLTAFSKLIPVFLNVIKEGHYILVLFDIPKHFSDSRQDSYLQEIAAQLTEVLVRRFPKINEIAKFIVCDKESSPDVFDNSIVMASLSDLSRQKRKDPEWMQNLGLVVAVNVFDKGVANLFETRRFSYQLRAVNETYQILVISPFRKDLEAALENTWVTAREKDLPDYQLIRTPSGSRQYYLGFHFEEFGARFNKVLKTIPSRVLYSGSEMLVFPLSTAIGKVKKAVTPVHQLELAYTNTLEGNEEIRNNVSFDDTYSVVFGKTTDTRTVDYVHPHILPVDEIIEPQVFSLIYDNENNAATSYMKWVHLGLEENFSIVISKPYLFRDYFAANMDYFTHAPFAALQPRLCKSRITLAIILLSMLTESKQDENAIRAQLLKYYEPDEVVSIPEKLKELFSTYFNDTLANDIRTSEEVVFDGNAYHSQVRFWIAHPDRIDLPYLKVVPFKDNNGNVIFEMLKDLLYQNYCKGQYHSFLGLPYTINDFDAANNTQNVSRSDSISNILFYRPCYSVKASLAKEHALPIKDLCMEAPIEYYHHTRLPLAYRMEAYETRISIDTRKWIVFENRYEAPLYSGGSSREIPASPASCPGRAYNRGKILKFSVRYLPQYQSSIHSIQRMMQILLYEGLQSLFPHHAQYLILASPGAREDQEELPWIFHEFSCDDTPKNGWLSFYFVEDAHIDLGLIGALTYNNLCDLFEYLFDYLIWLTEEPFTPEGYEDYLHRNSPDKLAFLKYGREKLPPYFDIDLAINFIRDHFSVNNKDLTTLQRKRNPQNQGMGYCDFCQKKMPNSEMTRLSDGRMRCPDCSVDAIDTEEQFQEQCDKVKDAFLKHLGIDFSTIQHKAHLVSAVELHRAVGKPFSITNGYDVRKLLGFAQNTRPDEFYVENGYSSYKTFGTIAHEMTHIWQFNDPDFKKLKAENELWVEGLAVWTDLFLSQKNGNPDVEVSREAWLSMDNNYGKGLKFILDHCPDDPYSYIHKTAQTI